MASLTFLKTEDALPPILVADDDHDDLFLIKHNIHIAGATNHVLAFESGLELVDFLKWFHATADLDKAIPPCVLFLDVRMPQFDGFRVLAWARAQPIFSDLRIVMISGAARPRDKERAFAMGAERFLIKPLDIPTLREVLGACGCTVRRTRTKFRARKVGI